ncbi:MAG TPA: type II toxin-antitoxin system PemK/MazF family toxin [Opitutaceae bacterium]|nr:type II toxin-antitoxin system PemK/MazF family toxin [Opitutaceae bacterium]
MPRLTDIIASAAVYNEVVDTAVVVPVSGQAPAIWPLRLAVANLAGKESFAILPGVRQVRKGRLRGALGSLAADQLSALDEGLAAYLR